AELERVRAEAAALQSGASGAETDRHLLESATDARELAEKWTAASKRLAELTATAAGDRLDAATLGEARWYPDTPPAGLHLLLEDLAAARRERDRLDARLREMATAQLPEPSDPIVVQLGTVDQVGLWRSCAQLEETS